MGAGTHGGSVAVPSDFIQLAASTVGSPVDCPRGCRGLLLGTAGTLNVTMENGEDRDGLPLPAGVTSGRFKALRTGGTAENIWAIV